jgi:hypothetical protein
MTPKIIYLKSSTLRGLLIWQGFGGRNWHWVIFINSTLPQVEQDRLLKHELVHSRQMNEIGAFKYAWNYFFNSKFRFEIELEANRLVDFNEYHKWRTEEEMVAYVRNLYNC